MHEVKVSRRAFANKGNKFRDSSANRSDIYAGYDRLIVLVNRCYRICGIKTAHFDYWQRHNETYTDSNLLRAAVVQRYDSRVTRATFAFCRAWLTDSLLVPPERKLKKTPFAWLSRMHAITRLRRDHITWWTRTAGDNTSTRRSNSLGKSYGFANLSSCSMS